MLDKQYICLGHDVTTIKIILGNLTEEKTVRKDTFTNIFSYQAILAFCKIPTLLSLTRPIIGHHEVWRLLIQTLKTKAPMRHNVEGNYWVPILHSYCTTISFLGFGRLVLGLLSIYSDHCYIYFILLFYTVLVLFWLLRWSFLWQW